MYPTLYANGRKEEEEEEDRAWGEREEGGELYRLCTKCVALSPDLPHFVFRFAFSIHFRVQWTFADPATTGPDHGWINEIAGYVELSCNYRLYLHNINSNENMTLCNVHNV